MFHEQSDREGVENVLPPGMYTIPKTCEYCGAESTDLCTDTCQRPKSFFRKQRPPFCPSDAEKWEPSTDYEISKRPETKPEETPTEEPKRRKSFMAFFGGAQ